ncbi:uncharacterized protein LOC110763841 [Prunus avium]|uniref:Uncharacterized protein LOC110763841 n=1 Tax=Prunus avium TaxID=42229 RepID=A0A6P5T5I3_PRUAV|nr:uncharacterized protein LOC110763841 [Prunus avium]
MTFLTLTPWLRCNVYDEDGRVWYEECVSARFIRPVEEAVRGALKNAKWDPLPPKTGKGKKATAVPLRPSAPVATVSKATAPPLARETVMTSAATPTSRATTAAGARKTLAHRIMPSFPPARPIAAVAPGRKRGREAASAEVMVTEGTPVERVAAEGEVVAEETAAAEAMVGEAAAAEVVVEEAATAKVAGTLDADATAAEVPATEAATADTLDSEDITVEIARAALVAPPPVVSAVPTSSVTASIEIPPVIPRRPSGIVIRSPPKSSLPSSPALIISSSQLVPAVVSMPLVLTSHESTVVTELVVVEATATGVPSPPPVSSTVLTEVAVAEVLAAPSFAEEPASSDDLAELYASLYEEGSSSASAPLDEDSRAIVERLREFLFFGVHQMTTVKAFMEFRSCLDATMALGLLNSAQLDELHARLAEGEEMIGRYAEATMRMAKGCSLEQELAVIKEQVRPAMAQLKENDLVVQRENEELAQVEAQIAKLQVRRALILQRRDGAVAVGAELKSSAKQILKAATEKKKALAERKLIRATW